MTLRYLSLFSFWLVSILCFDTAFLRQCSYFFSLMGAMVGHFSALLLLSVLRHCLQLEHECFWSGKNRYCACAGEGHFPVCTAGGRVAQEWLTLLRHSPWLWLVVLTWEWWILANQIEATGWSHRQWIFTQLACILVLAEIDTCPIWMGALSGSCS